MKLDAPLTTPSLRGLSLVRRVGGESAALISLLQSELDVARARASVERLLSHPSRSSQPAPPPSLSAARRASAITATSELAWNAVRHGGGGVLCAWVDRRGRRLSFRLIVADEGPGIQDIPWALQDQESSTDTLGLGLPGSLRLVDQLTITSPLPMLSHGTLVEACICFLL